MTRKWRLIAPFALLCATSMAAAPPAKGPARAAPARGAPAADPSLLAQDAFTSGMCFLQAGRLQDAADAFNRCLELDPRFAPAADGAGYAAIAQNQLEVAVLQLRRAIAIDSLYYEPREGLFFCLYLLDRRDEARRAFLEMIRIDLDHFAGANASWRKHSLFAREPRDAAVAYEKAYAQDSTNALTILLHGNALMAEGNAEAANSDWTLSGQRDPRLAVLPLLLTDAGGTRPDSLLARVDRVLAGGLDYAALRVQRGQELQQLEQPAAALAEYHRAAEMQPGLPVPHVNLAVLHELQGRGTEAEQELGAALRLSAYNPRFYGQDKSDVQDWLKLWARRTEQHPDDVVAWVLLGNAQAASGDEQAALASHRHAVELAPGSALAQLHYGTTCASTEDFEHALAALARAAQLDTALVAAHGQAALVYARQERSAEVLSALAPVVRAAPREATVYRLLGAANAELGRRSQAYVAFANVLRIDPGDLLTYKLRSLLRRKDGDRKGEILDLTRAIQISGGDTELHSLRAAAYRAVGNLAAAHKDEALAAGQPAQGGAGTLQQAPAGGSHRQTCSSCFGTGKMRCTYCFGMGYSNCNYCYGSGRNSVTGQTCNYCYGSGRRNCDFCFGTGKKQCVSCSGMGWVWQ